MIPEVRKAIILWKERVNISSLLILSLFATIAVFAEVQMGILEFLIDPIIGPIIIVILIAIMVPIHLIISRFHARLIIKKLNDRQQELHLMENLANLFEKNLTYARMLLPINEPFGWNKKIKARLLQLTEKAKDLVLLLNDSFSTYNEQPNTPNKADTQENYFDLSKLR